MARKDSDDVGCGNLTIVDQHLHEHYWPFLVSTRTCRPNPLPYQSNWQKEGCILLAWPHSHAVELAIHESGGLDGLLVEWGASKWPSPAT